MIILWPIGAVLTILFHILTVLLAPLLALTSDSNGMLPPRLYWFQTFDATLDEGRQPQYGFTGSDWWVRTRWLWRNPGYGFDYYLLGIKFVAADWVIVRNDDKMFLAYSRNGAFNFTTKRGWLRLKLGWKYWNRVETGNWDRFDKIPICCSVSR